MTDTITNTLKDLRLHSVDGVTKAIELLLGNPGKTKGDKPSPALLGVFEAVIEQVEQHGGFDAGIDRAMLKAREALGIPRKEQPKQEAQTNDAPTA